MSGATPVFSCHFDFTYAQKSLVLFEARLALFDGFVEVDSFCFAYLSAVFFLKVAVVGPILVFFGASVESLLLLEKFHDVVV